MIHSHAHAALILASVLFASPVKAASNPYGISEEMDLGLKTGFRQLFNFEFDEARKTFAALEPQPKEQPMAALAEVVRLWWEISSDVMEGDAQASKPFLEAAARCLKLSNEAIDKGDPRGLAHLCMGTTLGLMSRWSAANRSWVPAYLRGNKASNYLEKALSKNKKATDAYMCLGTFNYARELIMNRSGTGAKDVDDVGKLSVGLEQLRKAYDSATYFRQASGMMLAGLLTNDSPEMALPLLKELRGELPKSGVVHMVTVIALYNAGDLATMEVESIDLAAKADAGDYPSMFKARGQFALGLVEFRKKEWKKAADLFGNATIVGDARNPYVAWGHLYKGYALDAQGLRKKAKEEYHVVLKLPRRYASHDHAKERLVKPFRPTDSEMKKLEL